MEMHGLLSTSNQLVADEVHVETDQPLVWVTSQIGEGEHLTRLLTCCRALCYIQSSSYVCHVALQVCLFLLIQVTLFSQILQP